MDALIDDDLDNNNNVIPILNNNNNQNQVNLNNPPVLDALQEPPPRQEPRQEQEQQEQQEQQQQPPQPIDEHFNNINNSMENNRRERGADIVVNSPPQNHLNAANQNNENQMNFNAMHNDGNNDANENGIAEHHFNLNRLNHANNQNIRPPTFVQYNNSNCSNTTTTTATTIITTNNPTNVRKSKKRKRHYNVNKNKKWNKSYKRQKSSNTIKADAENAQQNNRNKHPYTKIPKIIFNNKQAIHRGSGLSKFFLPDKRPRKDIIVPPTKFLLGGNISDPLNLNSLQDEALSMSAVTPKSSPITTPPKVEVIIPPNIYDPLHLLDPVDSAEYEKRLVSPVKCRRLNKQRSRKKRIRKHSSGEQLPNTSMENAAAFVVSTLMQATATTITTMSSATAAAPITTTTTHINTAANASPKCVDASREYEPNEQDDGDAPSHSTAIIVDDRARLTRDLQLDLSAGSSIASRKRKNSESGGCSNAGNSSIAGGSKNKLRRFDSKDKIVSPVIPQPGAWKRPPKVLPMGAPRNRIRTTSTSDNDTGDEPNSKRPESTATAEELAIGSSNVPVINTGNVSPEQTLSNFRCEIATPNAAVDNVTFTAKNEGMGFKQESIEYHFGNYAGQYCGLQNLNNFSDVRLTVFMRHTYLFKDKDILDIGCNVGHMTIAVARRLHPKSIVGIDIDKNLIARARRNLSLFQRLQLDTTKINKLNHKIGENATHPDNMTESRSHHDKDKQVSSTKKSKYHRARDRDKYEQNHVDFFPVSFPICFGGFPNVRQITEAAGSSTSPSNSASSQTTAKPSAEQPTENSNQTEKETTSTATHAESTSEVPSTSKVIIDGNSMETTDSFPDNVFFRTLNYALTDESQMVSDKQQYDLILCLSLTKWIHLNCGDAGLKLTFRRMFNQLRPGGKLILEAQNWASYRKRKKLTPTIYNNYKNIEFFPNKFHEYLLSPEVGFSHSYTLGVPRHASKGFYRPIQLYIKGDFTPSQVRWSDTYHPQTPYEPRVRHAHYADPVRRQYGSFGKYRNMSNMYKNRRDTSFSMGANRYNTPSHGISSSTSRYYNPLETDSYLPSYDNVVPTRHYCFASPLYSTVWSPPASGRKSASQTPLFGSIRRVDADDQDIGTKHVYLTPRAFDHGGGSSRSIDESNNASPQTPVYAIGSNRSVRDSDLDANTNSPKHVYAFQ